jgi:hypothetical protein
MLKKCLIGLSLFAASSVTGAAYIVTQEKINTAKKHNVKPEVNNTGILAELTQGFSGSIPDEQGGQTKRNPFQGSRIQQFAAY